LEPGIAKMNGYANEQYAASLSEFGKLLYLPKSKGWLLQRDIADAQLGDAIGLYPLFQCENWQSLEHDFAAFGTNLCSVVLVCDPLEDVSEEQLFKLFPQHCRKFKKHYLIELSKMPEQFISSHHRYYTRYALKRCTVQLETENSTTLESWMKLYRGLIQQRGLSGISCFSETAFRKQFEMSEMDVFTARANGSIIGMQLWLRRKQKVYYHLSASNENGYSSSCSYGLLNTAIHHYKKAGFAWMNLGGVAGDQNEVNGLAAFKKGWSTAEGTAWLCGKILNETTYSELSERSGNTETTYFPAYRGLELNL